MTPRSLSQDGGPPPPPPPPRAGPGASHLPLQLLDVGLPVLVLPRDLSETETVALSRGRRDGRQHLRPGPLAGRDAVAGRDSRREGGTAEDRDVDAGGAEAGA